MGRLLKLERTTPTQPQVVRALALGWNRLLLPVALCNPLCVSLLFAQFAWETGWGKSCWRWNLGNHRTGPLKPPSPNGYEGDYVELKTADEYIDGKRVIVGGYFRAYHTIDEGALEHMAFLRGFKRYDRAMAVLFKATTLDSTPINAVRLGREFVHELKAGGYFTGPLDTYSDGVASIASKLIALPWLNREVMMHEPTPDVVRETVEPHAIGLPEPIPWYSNVSIALDAIFGSDWNAADERRLASVIACRYDCEVPV